MTFLALILLWLILLAVLASVLRRRAWAPGLLVAAGLAVLAWQLWQQPTEGTIELLGRTLDVEQAVGFFGFTMELDQPARAAAVLLSLWGALFALATTWIGGERVLFPSIPLILATLLLALTSTPLLWAPIWLVVAAILMAFPAQGASPRLARAALRTLLAPVLTLPFFLFAAWVLRQPSISVDDPVLWVNAWRSLVIGIAILLTPVPLHGWITALGEHAPPFAAAFIIGVWQLTVYALVRRILIEYPTMAEFADPALLLPWLAMIQMLWAAVFGLGSSRLGQFIGYLLLWDFGAAFLLWSLSGEFGTQSMVWLWLARPLVLVVVVAGLQVIDSRFGENAAYADIHGATERLPIASLSLIAGGLFLLGWPLGALYPVRLSTYLLAEATQSVIFLWALFALLVMTIALIRVLRVLTRRLHDTQVQREPARLGWLVLPLLLIGLLLFLNPALLNPVTARLTHWLSAI